MLEFKKLFCICVLFCITSDSFCKEIDSEVKRIREYTQELAKSVHGEFDPCKNFVDYACHEQIEDVITDRVTQEWISAKDENGLTPAEIKARKFYESCLNANSLTETRNVGEINWPVKEENWKPSNEIWTKPIGNSLYALDDWPIIETRVHNGNILISYGLTVMKNVYEEVIGESEEQEIVKVMKALDAEEETAKKLSAEIVETSRGIVKAMKDCPRNEDWYIQKKLKDLQNDFPAMDWKDILQRGNEAEANITDDSSITIIDQMCTLDYLSAVTKNIRGTYNYIFWISYKAGRRLPCLERTLSFFHQVFFNKFAGRYIDEKDNEKYTRVVRRVAEFVKDQTKIGNMNFREDEVDEFVRHQELIMEYIGKGMELNSFEKQLSEVSIDSDDYEGNLNTLESLTQITKKYPCEMPFERCMKPRDFGEFLTKIANQHNKPFSIAFPNLFSLVLRTLSDNREWNLYDFNTGKLPICYKSKKYNMPDILLSIYSPFDLVFQSKVLKESLENYKELINGDNSLDVNDLFDKNGLTPGQMFFIHFARDYCTKSLYHQLFFYMVLINTEDFAKEFHCPVGTPMNPVADNCLRM